MLFEEIPADTLPANLSRRRNPLEFYCQLKFFKTLNSLTHSMSQVSFYTPWKYQKTRGFIFFSGGIERDQCRQMD